MAATIEFREKKWRIWFKVLDMNRDGILTAEDWRQGGQAFVDSYHFKGDEAATAKKLFCDHAELIFNLGGKGEEQITEDGFVKSLTDHYVKDPAEARDLVSGTFRKFLEISDTNKDGYLSENEFIMSNAPFGFTAEQSKGMYAYMGELGPKGISIPNAVAYLAELVLGSDEAEYENIKDTLPVSESDK